MPYAPVFGLKHQPGTVAGMYACFRLFRTIFFLFEAKLSTRQSKRREQIPFVSTGIEGTFVFFLSGGITNAKAEFWSTSGTFILLSKRWCGLAAEFQSAEGTYSSLETWTDIQDFQRSAIRIKRQLRQEAWETKRGFHEGRCVWDRSGGFKRNKRHFASRWHLLQKQSFNVVCWKWMYGPASCTTEGDRGSTQSTTRTVILRQQGEEHLVVRFSRG